MNTRAIKIWIGISGTVVLGVLALLGFLVLDSGDSKNHLIQQKIPPDGRLVAELHDNITPQHGGPDTLYITLRPVKHAYGDEVYSRVYECSDVSAFRLEWEGFSELKIAYGSCNSSRWHTAEENTVRKSETVWQDVKIN